MTFDTGQLSGGRYRILGPLAIGGMGEVLTARDEEVGRDVVVKRMKADDTSPLAIRRFLREASIQGQLEHPAIVPVHGIGRDEAGLPYFAMKRLAGTTLAQILETKDPRYTRARLLRAFVDVCLAVELAHVRGILHRDLKPENIMLGDFGEVYVLDWGVAKVLGEDEAAYAGDRPAAAVGTTAGSFVGTPGYIAPEQVRGAPDIDGRADVYSLGCVLFEILAGESLHPGGFSGLESAVEGTDARPSARAPGVDIPPELDELCVRATATDRARRLASARELGDRVQRFLDGDRDLAKRQSLARDHLERARAMFAVGETDELRRTTIREAGRAIALDPALAGAAELVTRLMLEPPKATPREVETELADQNSRMLKSNARAGMWAYLAFLSFTPLMWWIAPAGSSYVIGVAVLIALNALVCTIAYAGTAPRPGVITLTNALLLGFIARMFTPFLFAPGLACVIAMAITLTPVFSRLTSAPAIAGITSLGILLPFAAERIGLLPVTTTVDTRGILLSAPGIAGNEGPTILVATLAVITLIAVACGLAEAMRRREREARRHLLIQAWQLRQLVQ